MLMVLGAAGMLVGVSLYYLRQQATPLRQGRPGQAQGWAGHLQVGVSLRAAASPVFVSVPACMRLAAQGCMCTARL